MATETFPLKAPSIPPSTEQDGQDGHISMAKRARSLARIVVGQGTVGPDGQPSAAAIEAAEIARECVQMSASSDPEVAAEGIAGIETLACVLGALRRSEAMTADDAEGMEIQLDRLVRERVTGESANAPGLAGAYQGAAMLRSLAALAPGKRTPELMNLLARAAQQFPQALGPGLLCDVLDPRQPGSLIVMQTSMLTAAMMPRPANPPRALVAAAITRMSGGSVPATDESNEWTRALAQRADPQAELFAAAVFQHPGLSASEAGRLAAAMTRPDSNRVDERMQTAIELTLDALRARLGHGNDDTINPSIIAAEIVQQADALQRLATLFAARSLNNAAGRGDAGADRIALEMLRAGIVEPTHLSTPLAAAAAMAANLTPEPQESEGVEPLPISEHVARRLASGLARVTVPLGEASRWAREISQKWTRLTPGELRTRAWSALTMAFELLADGRLPASRPALLDRLLRRGADPEAAERDIDERQIRFEDNLERVAATPFPLSLAVGAAPALLNISFVPGWRFGVNMEQLDRARQQGDWHPLHAANWLEANAIAVLADGELCGWLTPDTDANSIFTHVKPVPGSELDPAKEHEERAMGAVLNAVALAVAADSQMAVEGERLNGSIGMLAEMSGNADLQAFAVQGGERASAPEVQQLAASAGWGTGTPGVQVDVKPVAAEQMEAVAGERLESDTFEQPVLPEAPRGTGRRGR